MANLIVTVIAIALVAVASLMGAYYGGSAFLKGSAKAAASALVNQGQQIAAGWVLYANDHGGSAATQVEEALVDNSYITENPVPPSSADSASKTWLLGDSDGIFAAGSNEDVAATGELPVFAIIGIGNLNICNEINDGAGLVGNPPAYSTAAMFNNSRYACVETGNPTTSKYAVVYKIQ